MKKVILLCGDLNCSPKGAIYTFLNRASFNFKDVGR